MKFTRRQFNKSLAAGAGLAAMGPISSALAARNEMNPSAKPTRAQRFGLKAAPQTLT